MRIAVVTTSLDLGGITSFCISLVNYLASKSNVEVIFFYTKSNYGRLELISNDVTIEQFSKPNQRSFRFIWEIVIHGHLGKLIKLIRREHAKISPMESIQIIERIKEELSDDLPGEYDIAISTAEFYCNNLVANKVKAKRKIGWIHPDYSKLNVNKELELETLSKLDQVVGVSKASSDSLKTIFPSIANKICCIENILPIELIYKRSEEIVDIEIDKTKINLLTVCRVDNSSKRLDRMVKACAYLKDHGLEYHWYLIGNGPDLSEVIELAKQLKVQEYISFLGAKDNPYPYFKLMDVFVLTSQYEGKPIVVDEALALKCPVVVTNYKSAKAQVGEDYGAVIDNNDDTINAQLYLLLSSSGVISKWKANLSDYAVDNQSIYKKIDNLILQQND